MLVGNDTMFDRGTESNGAKHVNRVRREARKHFSRDEFTVTDVAGVGDHAFNTILRFMTPQNTKDGKIDSILAEFKLCYIHAEEAGEVFNNGDEEYDCQPPLDKPGHWHGEDVLLFLRA